MRIGVAIAVPEPHGGLLQRRRAEFGDPAAAAVPSHITLLPPTDVEPGQLGALRDHLAAIAAARAAFWVCLAGTASFRPRSPVVYVRLAEGGPHCDELQGSVRSGPVRRELDFPYHPHVTVAQAIADEALDRAERELAAFTAEWIADGFSLYEQGPDGVWRQAGEYPFGTGAPPRPPAVQSPAESPVVQSPVVQSSPFGLPAQR